MTVNDNLWMNARSPGVTRAISPISPSPRPAPLPPRPVAPPITMYPGAFQDRQGKFAVRQDCRWGNWGILDVPPALLWLEEADVVADLEFGLGYPPIVPYIDPWG